MAGVYVRSDVGSEACFLPICYKNYFCSIKYVKQTSDSLRKKWTFGLPGQRAASRRHVFEAHIHWFALILQVHRTQSFNNLGEEVAIRYR
jgi:hypothetical protein